MEKKRLPPINSDIFFYPQEQPGYLRITGPDRQAFLQRQTTNDIDRLSAEKALVTVLTSPTGRILDVLSVIEDDEVLYVLTLPQQGENTYSFLRSRIFFKDKVSISEISQEICQVDLLGPGVGIFLQELGATQPVLEKGAFPFQIAGNSVWVLKYESLGNRLLVGREMWPAVLTELQEKGAKALSTESYQVMRVESGLPAPGHELSEDYSPLETGLQWAVAENKGCYTGQEVLARQINYDKITRSLVGLLMEEVPSIGDQVYIPDSNQPQGQITSIAESRRFGPIALAVIKRPHHLPGNNLIIQSGDKNVSSQTVALPFQESVFPLEQSSSR
ncbi:MAG: folate-binding protein YgfZ [Chloroflexota bacterium]|nr:MAG: folate-binding protein YgfZ [Chloroflexota bacterium]